MGRDTRSSWRGNLWASTSIESLCALWSGRRAGRVFIWKSKCPTAFIRLYKATIVLPTMSPHGCFPLYYVLPTATIARLSACAPCRCTVRSTRHVRNVIKVVFSSSFQRGVFKVPDRVPHPKGVLLQTPSGWGNSNPFCF